MKQCLQNYWIRILIVLVVIGLIWYNSIQPEGISDGLSLLVTSYLKPVLYSMGITGDLWSLNRIVRKLAHVFEFAVLGAGLYAVIHKIDEDYAELKVVCLGSIIAVCDELIQLFSYGRNASIRDLIIDTAGVIIGVITIRFIISIYKRLTKQR